MSEAMSKVEIEDVLSSIRRLVSEDSTPSIVRGGPSLERRDMTLGPERLILTPALRVVAEEQAEAPPPEALVPHPSLTLGLPAAAAPIGALVAGLGAAVDAQEEEWESETGDDPPPLPDGGAVLEEAEWDGEGPVLTFAAYPRVQLVNPVVTPRAASPVVDEVIEAVDEEVLADPWAAPALHDFIEEPAEAEPVDEIADEVVDDVAVWAQEGEDEPQDTLARGAPTIEPDADWADAAEAEAVGELADHVTGRIEAMDLPEMQDEALRDLVRELIVEELQGALGQRITRNIRKLVRAEIARAMATDQMY